jgi:hypothetical protein
MTKKKEKYTEEEKKALLAKFVKRWFKKIKK